MRTERLLVYAVAVMVTAGCSIINRFEDFERPEEGGAGGIGTGSPGGAGSDSVIGGQPGSGGSNEDGVSGTGGDGSTNNSCGPGTRLCGGLCVPIDDNNCSDCGDVCPDGRICSEEQCTCEPPSTDCDGACVDVAYDPENCGQCGNVCVDPEPLCSSAWKKS